VGIYYLNCRISYVTHTAGCDSRNIKPHLSHCSSFKPQGLWRAPIYFKAIILWADFRQIYVLSEWDTGSWKNLLFVTRLPPQSARHFAWQPSEHGPPTTVTWLQLLRKQKNTGTSTALTANTDLRAYDFAHSPFLWPQPRLSNVTFAWRWRLCGINPAVPPSLTSKNPEVCPHSVFTIFNLILTRNRSTLPPTYLYLEENRT
jgi:hypothetical protein